MTERLIQVLPYDPEWPQRFAAEAAALHPIFEAANTVSAGNCESTAPPVIMHHIGSTAVPGLPAKPIIDIIPVVADITQLDAGTPAAEALEALEYEGLDEFGLPGRRYFRKLDGVQHLVHLHCYQSGDAEITRHLALRDYLRAHPASAAAYGKLKQRLAARFPHDSHAYQDGKDEFVQDLERRALEWQVQS